jgi:hypothetical protein
MLRPCFIKRFSSPPTPASLIVLGVVISYGAFNNVLILRTPSAWLMERLGITALTSSANVVKVEEA